MSLSEGLAHSRTVPMRCHELGTAFVDVAGVRKVSNRKLTFYAGHLEGGQPVPHPDFEKRYLGGLGPPFPADLGDATLGQVPGPTSAGKMPEISIVILLTSYSCVTQ